MEKDEIFSVKKSPFSSPENLRIVDEHIAPFLSEMNYIKVNSNGAGPEVLSSKVLDKIKREYEFRMKKPMRFF